MSISTSVVGIRDLDKDFAKMIAVKVTCDAAGIRYPLAITAYFGDYVNESIDFLRREMETMNIEWAVQEDNSVDMCNSWIVDLSKLPKDVKVIKFTNSY